MAAMPEFEFPVDPEMLVRAQFAEFIASIREWGEGLAMLNMALEALGEGWDLFPESKVTKREFVSGLATTLGDGMGVLYEIVQKAAVNLFGEELDFGHSPDCDCGNED